MHVAYETCCIPKGKLFIIHYNLSLVPSITVKLLYDKVSNSVLTIVNWMDSQQGAATDGQDYRDHVHWHKSLMKSLVDAGFPKEKA